MCLGTSRWKGWAHKPQVARKSSLATRTFTGFWQSQIQSRSREPEPAPRDLLPRTPKPGGRAWPWDYPDRLMAPRGCLVAV